MNRKLLIGLALAALLAAGATLAVLMRASDEPAGELDTDLEGVSVVAGATSVEEETTPPTGTEPKPGATAEANPRKKAYAYTNHDRLCWPNFGRDPRRSLALPDVPLGKPTKHFWVRALGSYIEYPPSYCDGVLYVNTFKGMTFAINAHNGNVLWRRQNRGHTPSTPAIAGPRLIVSSTGGTVTAYHRKNGRTLWQIRIRAKVESSPVVVKRTVYFGATDGRLFAVAVRTGRIRWAYNTGGRINSSPTVLGPRVCITTYAGSIFCLQRSNGKKLWSTYIKRDFLRHDSFYASASSDGRRLFTISRSGRVLALAAWNGRVLWTHKLRAWGYSTPAVAHGLVFVGDFTGTMHAYNAATGRERWRRRVGGRILGPAFVVGNLVFFSNLETNTFAVRVADGRVVWRLPIGKYSPGIATDRHYFFSLNGLLIAYWGTRAAVYDRGKTRYVPVAKLLR